MGILENLLLSFSNWFMNWPIYLEALIVGLTGQALVALGVHNILFFVASADIKKENSFFLFLSATFATRLKIWKYNG
ncbi:hypothetical protein [Spiroplasma endosymbiont of Dioctria linearis]|uniref:hypothetical protein n=1 Tax=Spiroplasma endosymbiont of Dioctria linearis TaxID=3066290 RepID=UPI00313A7982